MTHSAIQPEAAHDIGKMRALKDFWFYFSVNRGAVIGLYVFMAVILVAILAPVIAPHSPVDQFRDYIKLRRLFGRLLAEIQRIKSEGDFESARDLVESHGVNVDARLHREVLERYRALHVAPYAGFIQPELVPVMQGEEIVDVRIEYPTDFAAQQLRYSARYSFLPTYN